MNLKNLSPVDIVKLSTSISLILLEKFDDNEICIIKNLLSAINTNLSTFQTQKCILEKLKK